MNEPRMLAPRALDDRTTVLPATLPVPGAGRLAVNAAVIRAAQPLLLDTGLAALRDPFLAALEQAIDPADLRWIWITHADPDHLGNLAAVLERAPRAQVVTNYLGMGKLGLLGLPTDRVRLLNPGQRLDLGDGELVALRPPVYDAPETMAAFDPAGRTLYSADSFGALLDRDVEDARELADGELRDGLLGWSRVDAPWLGDVDRARFAAALAGIDALGAERVVGGHLAPAVGLTGTLLRHLADAPDHDDFVGPDHDAFMAMLAEADAS